MSIYICNHCSCLQLPNEYSPFHRPPCTIHSILKHAQRLELLSGWKRAIALILIKFPHSELRLCCMPCDQIPSIFWGCSNTVRGKLKLWFFEEWVQSSVLWLPHMRFFISCWGRDHKRIGESIYIFQEISVEGRSHLDCYLVYRLLFHFFTEGWRS